VIRSSLIFAGLAAATLLSAGCPTSYSDRPVDPETGILNFAKVSDALYRGGHPSAEGFAKLKGRGVRTVVSLRTFNVHRSRLRGLGLRYVHISFKAGHAEDEDVVRFLKVMADPANHPVFVHCKWGTDRSGLMAAVYRMVVEGWPRERAIAEMRAMGYEEDKWPQMRDYLERLDAAALQKKVKEADPPEIVVIP
jgi:tyrosine-protein phosphatase SIW14